MGNDPERLLGRRRKQGKRFRGSRWELSRHHRLAFSGKVFCATARFRAMCTRNAASQRGGRSKRRATDLALAVRAACAGGFRLVALGLGMSKDARKRANERTFIFFTRQVRHPFLLRVYFGRLRVTGSERMGPVKIWE